VRAFCCDETGQANIADQGRIAASITYEQYSVRAVYTEK
jgi:hypothetical protein